METNPMVGWCWVGVCKSSLPKDLGGQLDRRTCLIIVNIDREKRASIAVD